MLTTGFASALALWVAWYVTHLPMMGFTEQTTLPIVVAVWGGVLSLVGWSVGKKRGVLVGAGAGLLSALLGLMVLGSKVTQQSAAAQATQSGSTLVPNAWLILCGFLFAGLALGAVCGFIGGLVRGHDVVREERTWFARFALVTMLSFVPLIVAGGLVTSTNSGMAVPDWPNSFGSNMFLYPLGPRAVVPVGGDAKKIFLEHSHRLFGTLAGLHTIVLMVWAFVSASGKKVRVLAIALFVLIALQGVLGGKRVVLDSRALGIIHGVGAQIIFLLAAMIATKASLAYRSLSSPTAAPEGKKFRVLSTAALHATLLQLLLGAVYRHLRSDHVLYTHAALAFVVMVLASMAAALAIKVGQHERTQGSRSLGGVLGTLGKSLTGVIGLQFLLGWAAFLVGGRGIEAASTGQALLRTAHQANGALTIALLGAIFVLARAASPKRPRHGPGTG